MPNCPHCLEEIKIGARKCPHCQTSLEPAKESEGGTIYVLDKGLLKFAKFAVGVLAIFVLVGVYLFGYDIKETSKKTSEAEFQVQKAILEIERQRAALESKIGVSEQRIARIEAIEREIVSHRNSTEQSLAEARQLVLEIRRRSEEAGQIVIEMRTLGRNETNVAMAKREERGIDPDRGKLWKNGSTVTFRFIDGSEQHKAIVRLAADEWAKHVNLTFKEVASGPAELRVTFSGIGSWSYVGTDALGIPDGTATLTYASVAQAKDRDVAIQIALHEFGHALGLVHEFQNPSAGEVFNRAAVLARYSAAPYLWGQATIETNILTKVSAYPGRRDYDPESIMNYEFPRDVFVPGKETRPGKTLSESDKRYVASLYPRS